jgi:glutamine synthetase
MTRSEVMQLIKDEGIQVIDLKFVDLPGLWQHFSMSAREFGEESFSEGVGFDGSS